MRQTPHSLICRYFNDKESKISARRNFKIRERSYQSCPRIQTRVNSSISMSPVKQNYNFQSKPFGNRSNSYTIIRKQDFGIFSETALPGYMRKKERKVRKHCCYSPENESTVSYILTSYWSAVRDRRGS